MRRALRQMTRLVERLTAKGAPRRRDERAPREGEDHAPRLAADVHEEYLSILSHELRNPLVGIAAAAQVLARELAESPQALRATAIAAEATHLLSLLEEVTEATRIESGNLRSVLAPTDLARVVRTAVASLHLADHHVLLRGTDVEVPVLADERRIRQVVANLVGNAAAYAPPGTQVEVSVGLAPDVRAAVVEVRDHGPGIPPPERERLFGKFARLSTSDGTRGSGLGLYICRAIVADHGGELRADWPADGGTAFSFTLPLAAAARRGETPLSVSAP